MAWHVCHELLAPSQPWNATVRLAANKHCSVFSKSLLLPPGSSFVTGMMNGMVICSYMFLIYTSFFPCTCTCSYSMYACTIRLSRCDMSVYMAASCNPMLHPNHTRPRYYTATSVYNTNLPVMTLCRNNIVHVFCSIIFTEP